MKPKQKKRRKKTSQHPAQNLSTTILQFVQGKRYKPLTYEKFLQLLNIPPIHKESLKKILNHFVQDGVLVLQKNKYAIPRKTPLATGTISVHPKGFGFVKNSEGGPDIFIPKQRLNDAVDGDEVEVEIDPRLSLKGPEGTVIAILKRGRSSLAATVIHKSGRHFTAFSPLLGENKPIILKAPKGIILETGDRVICKVTSWGGDSSEAIAATVVRRIGNISDPSIDIEAAIAEFELPDGFSVEAISEAKQYGARVLAKDALHRLNLTELECVTIDPDTARDFDDAISLTKDAEGNFHLGVHIADVAHYVRPGTHLDREAYERCNSTYFPGQCIPMLPEELSNELCSLKPNVKRLVQSVLVVFNAKGSLLRYEIKRTVIKSRKRFTYKQAMDVLEKKEKSSHLPLLERMVELCHLLKQKRFERGSIDFSMTENAIIVDEAGVPLRIDQIEYDITHQMIEEFMLKANEMVATHLQKQGHSLIYRIHEEPTAESFKDFYAFARTLGFQLSSKPTHRDIQKLFQDAKDSPLLAQLSVSFIRSMRLAAYSPDNIGHYGLALEHYCHFTSPIRRYTDLIIQRLLCNELPDGLPLVSDCVNSFKYLNPDLPDEQSAERDSNLHQVVEREHKARRDKDGSNTATNLRNQTLEDIAQKCSEKERISFRAESSVKLLKKLRLANTYFTDDPYRIYPATITRIKPFSLHFEVSLFYLEGSLHVSEIGNDYFEFNPHAMAFQGVHTGKTYQIGQTIFVRLDSINYILQQTKWSITHPPSTRPATPRKKH
ncbi:MAG TPA: VacB/RNase II family 3'-5' exoribonuclease [Chlamydiales bacterium]|nr:VacB/RNase II family 3'-5' exoribonuclease [Chlamydiales bacterium]